MNEAITLGLLLIIDIKLRKTPSLGLSYRDRLVDVMAETLLLVLVADHGHGAVLTHSTPLLELISIIKFLRTAHCTLKNTTHFYPKQSPLL